MKKKEISATLLRTLAVGAVAFVFVIPLLWMILSSLKPSNEVFARPYHWLPSVWKWENYMTVWTAKDMPLLRAFYNSLYIVFFSIAGQMLISSTAAYAFAKIDFKGKNFIFLLFLFHSQFDVVELLLAHPFHHRETVGHTLAVLDHKLRVVLALVYLVTGFQKVLIRFVV